MIGPNSSAGWEEFQQSLGEYRKGKPGSVGVTLLRSYAYPGKYVLVSRWESPEACWELQKSKGYLDVLKGAASLNTTRGRPQEGYVDVFNVDADGMSAGTVGDFKCEVLFDWHLDSARKAGEFEENRKQYFELNKKHHKGFGSSRLRRSAGDPLRYLGIGIYADRESAVGGAPVPEIQKFLADNNSRPLLREPQTIEAFAVIHRM